MKESRLREIVAEEILKEIMTKKEFMTKADNIEKTMKWMSKEIDKAIKNKDQKRLDFFADYADKMSKVLSR